MALESQGSSFSPAEKELPSRGQMNQKESVLKFPDSVQGDGIERPSASGQPNIVQYGNENKGKDTSDSASRSLDNAKSEGEHSKVDEKVELASAKHNQYRLMGDNAKSEVQIPAPENQKYPPEPPKSGYNLQQSTQNSFRPSENAFAKPAMAPGMQVRPPSNNPVSGQPLRKPDISPSGYQQSYPNQSRQYQMPNVGYSSSSYQPSPQPHQTYSSPQMKGEMLRPNFSYQNQTPMTAPTPMQRTYPQTQSYSDLPQQRIVNPSSPRPPLTQQPTMNRPQTYQPSSTQRPLPENYQKSPSMQPPRANFNPNMAHADPNQHYYGPMRMTPLSPNISSTSGSLSNLGNGTSRYTTDTSMIRSPSPLTNTALDPRSNYVATSLTTDPNRNIRQGIGMDSMGAKKSENEEIKANNLPREKQEDKTKKEECPVLEGENVPTNSKGKEEKEPGIVHTNVKYFEERDTAKVPLTPKISSPIKPAPPSRSATFIAGNVVKGELYEEDEYESGVDVSPLIHPNLRNVPFDFSGGSNRRSRERYRKNNSATSENVRTNSYPSTPVKFTPRITKDTSHRSMSRSPSKSHKSIFELTPEEEFLYFFNIARASYKNFYDRSSRIDDMTCRKENMPTANGDVHGAKKTPTKLPAPTKRSLSASSPTKTPLKSPGVPKSLPKTPDSPASQTPLIKKVPMNKIQVGAAPSPNLKAVKSKIGSLANTTHKPGGGNIKIESHKIDFSKTQPRIAAKNDTYTPGGGDKKIEQVKLQWSAKSKVGSLENAAHKPGGGDKKIESVKLDFKDKAKPKVGSKDNVKHVPGGGAVKNSVSPLEWNSMNIESQKLEFKAQSKIGSLDNVKHKPGGGDVKIFDDKTYLKQISCGSSEGRASGTQSYCDLSVVSEIHSISAPGTPHHGTAIKIKKSTTLGRTKEEIRKTTEVTVVSRSPSIERKSLTKSPSTHEVKLTYAKVASPKHVKPGLNVGPVEVVNVQANENAAIFKPVDTPVEVKNLISNFEQITGNKGFPLNNDGKNFPKTKPEPVLDPRMSAKVNEELAQKFSSVKEELDRLSQDKKTEETAPKAGVHSDENTEENGSVSKFLRNEMAAHEKVGEIWKEVHNIGPDKPAPPKSEELPPPPPPPTPSVVQKPGFQPQQLQNPSQQPPNMRFPGPRNLPPQQNPRFPNQPLGMQRPPVQNPQRPQFPQNQPQIRSPISPQSQRQPYPELGSGPFQVKPGSMPPRSSPSDSSEYHPTPQQASTPTASLSRANINTSK